MGVTGSVSLLQNITIASQPVSSMDWSPDKVDLCLYSLFSDALQAIPIAAWTKDLIAQKLVV